MVRGFCTKEKIKSIVTFLKYISASFFATIKETTDYQNKSFSINLQLVVHFPFESHQVSKASCINFNYRLRPNQDSVKNLSTFSNLVTFGSSR